MGEMLPPETFSFTIVKWQGSQMATKVNNIMEHSPSWEADRSSASHEIPRILWNSKVCFHVHKSPPPVSIPIPIGPVHTPILFPEDPF